METQRLARRAKVKTLGIGLMVALMIASCPPAAVADRPLPETGVFEVPVDGVLIREFDPPQQRWRAGHRGVDLTVEVGGQVRSAGAGVVAFAGVVVDRPVVSIDHPNGIRTTYEPLTTDLRAGDEVASGQVIGTIAEGNQHCAVPCLHWGARIGPEEYIDPFRLLRPAVIRLLPPEPW